MRFLQEDEVRAIHALALETHGGLDGVRDMAGLRSAVVAPEQAYAYGVVDVFELAARYAFHLSASQAFLDGNKRAGLGAALTFLDANGYEWVGAPDDFAAAISGLSDKSVSLNELAEQFRAACRER